MLKKLTSRKFILALAGLITGICTLFGGEELISQVAGAVTALAATVTYIVSEGQIDREAVAQLRDAAPGNADSMDLPEDASENGTEPS